MDASLKNQAVGMVNVVTSVFSKFPSTSQRIIVLTVPADAGVSVNPLNVVIPPEALEPKVEF